MRIIAFRPEYQILVEDAKNRVFYQNLPPMRLAMALPHYLSDWATALAEVAPGFTILCDMQVVNQACPELLARFRTVERLIVERGVSIVAEVHIPGLPTRRVTDEVTTSHAMPVRHFLSIWEGAQFLDDIARAEAERKADILPHSHSLHRLNTQRF